MNNLRRFAVRRLAAGVALAFFNPAALRAAGDVPDAVGTPRVRVREAAWKGRNALAVELTDDEQARVLKTGGNGPTYAVVRHDFADGVIEVDVAAELTGKGAPSARGFVGIAFHIDPAAERYEAVYLRMTNGRLNQPVPPSPLVERAVQYVAHPDFHYYVSRGKYPGRYERGADVALGRWHRLRLEIIGARMRASVDGAEVLAVDDLRYASRRGPVGLFIDDGTRGYFRGVEVVHASGRPRGLGRQ
jgi:hypothetical protein